MNFLYRFYGGFIYNGKNLEIIYMFLRGLIGLVKLVKINKLLGYKKIKIVLKWIFLYKKKMKDCIFCDFDWVIFYKNI